MTDQPKALLPVSQDRLIYVRWSDDGQHIRKWAHEPFEGATPLVNAGNVGMREALEVSERFLNACNSAWAAGEPSHRVVTMLNLADEFRKAIDAALTPSPCPGDGMPEPWPGCYADLQRRRVTTLAKLGLMLSVMAGGDAPEVVGYDAAELYAEVLMALAIEDAEDTDIALEVARDHPSGDCLHRISCPPVTEEAEKVAAWLEQYPSPMNDLDMAMRIRQICAAIRAGEHRKSDAAPSGEAGEGKPNGVAENKAGGLWYRRWHTAQTRVNELEALLANPPKHKFWGAGEPDCPREIKAPNGELHTLRCKACGMDNPSDDICRTALTPSALSGDAGEGE